MTSVTLLVSNLKQYIKGLSAGKAEAKARDTYLVKVGSSKSKSSKATTSKLTRSELNECLVALELDERVCVRACETVEELKDLVVSYTKAIGEYDKHGQLAEQMLFCEKAVEKSQTRVKDGQGLINVWKDLVETFPLVSSDQAEAICSVYPSPLMLKKVGRF